MLPKSRLQELFLEFAKEGIAAEEAMHDMLMSEFGGTDVAARMLHKTARLLHLRRDCYSKGAIATTIICTVQTKAVILHSLSKEKVFS